MSVNLNYRSDVKELMDDLDCSGAWVNQTLHELDVINYWLGGNAVSLKGIDHLLKKVATPISIIDLGCGSGDLLKKMAVRFGNKLELGIGIDANTNIIEYAANHCAGLNNLVFKSQNIFDESFSRLKADILHASLFLHHFKEEELILLLKIFKSQATLGIVISDLHIHWLAYYSIKWLTKWFSKSVMVQNDSTLSVKRGFRRNEWIKILKAADIHDFDISWKWAFRLQIIIKFQ